MVLPYQEGIEVIPGEKAIRLWGEVMRIRVILWGEAIENY